MRIALVLLIRIGIGRGSELAQIRPYEPVEDDVRQIDWNVTARTGTPHVRIHLAERALVTWLVLDTSPSMTFGTAERRKADYIVRLNWKIGRSQIGVYRTNGDLVGVADKSSINGSVKAACELIKRDLPQTAAKTEEKPDPAPTK